MNIKQIVKKEVGNKKYPVKLRIKIGRALHIIALLPLGTSPLFLLSFPMSMTISPTVWARGKLNQRKGNGDLIL